MDYNYNQQEKTIDELQKKLFSLRTQIIEKAKQLYEIQSNIDYVQGRIIAEDLGISYEKTYNEQNKAEFAIEEIKDELAIMLKSESYFNMKRKYIIDGSEKKGRDFVKAFCENNILGFNLYCEKKRKLVKETNYGTTIDLIDKAFNRYNKRLNIVYGEFNPEYLHWMKKLVKAELDLKILKTEERERIKEEKRRLREEQQLLAEAEKERKRLEEERKAMNIAFNKALTEFEREQIKNKLSEIDKRISDVDYRVNNPKAGWVYIIHSNSLPNLEKIGVSRRLSGPHERVKELSGPGIPTPFMIDAFCFSDDAFELESNLHKYFDKQRVNPNKEFFRITAQEAINAMENVFNHKAHIVNLEENNNEID